MTITFRRFSALTAAGLLTVSLAACSDSDNTDSNEPTDSSNQKTQAAEHADHGLALLEGYVGAKDSSTEMTAVFGTLSNETDEDIHLTEVTGDLPGVYEYHEVVDGVMQQTSDGLVVPANGTLVLEPGGDHIMIMDNPDEIAAGDVLSLTLTDDQDTEYNIADLPVRVQQSGHEDYGHGEEH